MHVVLGVSHTLGVTDGPRVTWFSVHNALYSASFLSPMASLHPYHSVMSAVDLADRRPPVPLCGLMAQRNISHNHKWLVVHSNSGGCAIIGVWKLSGEDFRFPQGGHVIMDFTSIEAQSVVTKLFVTRGGRPAAGISDGDELCILTLDKDSNFLLRVVDIQKCFDSRQLVVVKECTIRAQNNMVPDDVWGDLERGLFVVFRINPLSWTSAAMIYDVATGECTILNSRNVFPLDDSHYCATFHSTLSLPEARGTMKNGIYQKGTNKLVKEWDGYAERYWGNGLLFILENNGKITCSEALSGLHIASFSVVGSNSITICHPHTV